MAEGLKKSFDRATRSGEIPNGFNILMESTLSRSDILMLSDVDHMLNQYYTSEVFSSEHLELLHKKGVTDIYIENLQTAQFLADNLAKGQLSREEFIREMDKITYLQWVEDSGFVIAQEADLIMNASKLDPPIKIHFAQMDRLDEEQKIEDLLLTEWENAENKLDSSVTNGLNQFLLNGVPQDNINNISDEIKNLKQGIRSANTYDELNKFSIGRLVDTFAFNLPQNIRDDFVKKVSQEFEDFTNKKESHSAQVIKARQNSDPRLVDHVIKTRNPNGIAIVVHGGDHDARVYDTDELFEEKGLRVSKANLIGLPPTDYSPVRSGQSDTSGTDYHYKEDVLILRSNDQGIVNGLDAQNPLYRNLPKQNPADMKPAGFGMN